MSSGGLAPFSFRSEMRALTNLSRLPLGIVRNAE